MGEAMSVTPAFLESTKQLVTTMLSSDTLEEDLSKFHFRLLNHILQHPERTKDVDELTAVFSHLYYENTEPTAEVRRAFLLGRLVGICEPLQLTIKEVNRVVGKASNNATRKADADVIGDMCRSLFAEYAPADLKRKNNKGGKFATYKEIGEVVAKRLNLPVAIDKDVVRKHVKKK